jgi:hypothetical protein
MMLMSTLLKDDSPTSADQRARVAQCFHLGIALQIALADLGLLCEDRAILDPSKVMQ